MTLTEPLNLQSIGAGGPSSQSCSGSWKLRQLKRKKTRKRRGSTEASTDHASDLLAKIEAEMPWSEHWECRNCRRVVDAMTGCLKVSGRRAGAFLADEAAVSVSQRCFDLSEKLEERQTLFDEMRDDFQRMVMKPLKPARKKAVLEAPTPLLANVLTVCGQQLVDKSFAQGKYVKVPTAQNSTSTIQRRGIAAQTDASISPTPTSLHQHYTSLPCAPTHPLTHPPIRHTRTYVPQVPTVTDMWWHTKCTYTQSSNPSYIHTVHRTYMSIHA